MITKHSNQISRRPNLFILMISKAIIIALILFAGEVRADRVFSGVSEEPQVQTHCAGVPVKRFGFCWVLGESPTFVNDTALQQGNISPRIKVPIKSSREISRNYIGVTTSRMPRSTANDYLPVEAVHLIDGDLQSCWLSRGQTRPDAQPIWIRLDFPLEQKINRVVLRKRPLSTTPRSRLGWAPTKDAVEVGRGMPRTITIKSSRDSASWQTLFDGATCDAPDKFECEFRFPVQPVKQLWITAGSLQMVENILYAFSLAEVEVYNESGQNVALISRGTGVTVNSTHHTPGQELAAHRWYWPLNYDAGVKWARVGYHDDPINWHWVEKQKGVLKIDPVTDAAVSELVTNGVEIIMSLNFGNRLYSGPDQRSIPQLWEWNYDMPKPPTTPEALAAWGRYVEFMVKHFRGRVHHFEVWNEWNISCYWGDTPNLEHFLAVSRVAIPIIRKYAPEAKIMMGSVAGFPHGISGWKPAELVQKEREIMYLQAMRALAGDVDEIGWHPFYNRDPDSLLNYTSDVKAFQSWLRSVGFKGHCMATEWNYGALYPFVADKDVPNVWCGPFNCSEIDKAKYVAQAFTRHAGLGIESFFCELYFSHFGTVDLSLMRSTFHADPIAPLQPQAAYYVTRNLATIMDGMEPDEFKCEVAPSPEHLELFTFSAPGGRAVALWVGGRADDAGRKTTVTLKLPFGCRSAEAFDPINGVSQSLVIKPTTGGTKIRGLVVGDAPLIVRVAYP
jgi:hypothetical protein